MSTGWYARVHRLFDPFVGTLSIIRQRQKARVWTNCLHFSLCLITRLGLGTALRAERFLNNSKVDMVQQIEITRAAQSSCWLFSIITGFA